MRNGLIKLVFVISLIFCFYGIDVRAIDDISDSDYRIYIHDDDLLDLNSNSCVLNIRDIVGIDNSEIIPSCDIFNRYVNDVILVDEEVNSSKNVIILLIVLIVIGLIQLIFFDEKE